MKEVLTKVKIDALVVYESDIQHDIPIFVKKNGKLVGMLVHEGLTGWIIRLGGEIGATGYHESRLACMTDAHMYNYTFHIEE